MHKKLRLEDRHAADLLLDRTATAAKGNGQAFYASAQPALRPRVKRLQQLLQLLDVLPAAEPPRDLISRTLERIDFACHHEAGRAAGEMVTPVGPLV